MPVLRAEAGTRPGGRGACFFVCPRKKPQKKGAPHPPTPPPPAAGAASRGRTATLAIASLGLAVAARSARVCSDCYRPRAAGAIEKSNHYVEEPLTRAPPVIDLNLSSCALL